MEFQEIVDLLYTTSDDKIFQDFLLKNGLKFAIRQEKTVTMLTKKLELKH